MPTRTVTSRKPIPNDVLFHVERSDGRIDEFRKGDLASYNGTVVTIVDIPETVMGHLIETPEGGIICLDICTVLIDGKLVNIETEKLFQLIC